MVGRFPLILPVRNRDYKACTIIPIKIPRDEGQLKVDGICGCGADGVVGFEGFTLLQGVFYGFAKGF